MLFESLNQSQGQVFGNFQVICCVVLFTFFMLLLISQRFLIRTYCVTRLNLFVREIYMKRFKISIMIVLSNVLVVAI